MPGVLGPNFGHDPIPMLNRGEGPPHRGPETAIEGTAALDVAWDGLRPEQLTEWYEHQNPYHNLANSEVVRRRALNYVTHRVRDYDQKTLMLQKKWQVLNYILTGSSIVNYEDPDGAHSPQIYQMVENLEARITEAALALSAGGDAEWFKAKGREALDRRSEEIVTAWHDYVMDKNKWRSRLPEMVRTALIHGFCPLKSRWHDEVQFVVERDRTVTTTKKGRRWTTKRRLRRKLLWSAPVFDQIEPAWFMCDTTKTDPQKMLWVGDRQLMTLDELMDLQDKGVLMNVLELAEHEPKTWGELFSDWSTASRSVTHPYDILTSINRPDGAPKCYHVVEIWGRFDIYGTGLTRECVITVANGDIVLQVRENPLDSKRRPYATARFCKYPFDFHSVGPLDHCLQPQIEIDILRALGIQGARLAVNPMIITDSMSDLGDSIYPLIPGKVIDAAPNSIEFTQIKSPINELAAAESMLRQDIEETAGSPRVYMGGDQAGSLTATEYQGRLQEANKRVRTYIRAVTDMAEQLLQNNHTLTAQYLTQDVTFRVLGRRGHLLRKHETVDPQMFDADVDFEFVAISNLHVSGMETTNMQLYLNTMMPLLKSDPGLLDIGRFAQRFAKLLLGDRASDYVNVQQDPRDLMDQREENILLLQGQPVPIMEDDDDEEHVEILMLLLGSDEFEEAPDEIKLMVQEHLFAHIAQQGRKERQQKAIQSRRSPYEPRQQSGEDDGMTNLQRSTAAGASQTNGPTNGAQISKPGREASFFQDQQ